MNFGKSKIFTKANSFVFSLLLGIVAVNVSGCVSFAPPIPLMTFGGPKTAAPGHWELGAGVGSAAFSFNNSLAGGNGYLGHWRVGLSKKIDFGFDIMGAQHSESSTFTFKPSLRFQATDHLRIETSVGAADDSQGKSIGGELGFVVGTAHNAPWNYYGALRFAGSLGFNAYNHRHPPAGEPQPPSDAGFGLLSVGSAARLSPTSHFITEAGYGLLYIRNTNEYAQMMYIGVGVLFNIDGRK